jgi:hypothetical protein
VVAQAIRPPTVAAGTSRLRLAAMASHTASELEMAAGVLGTAARELGLEPSSLAPPLAEQQLALAEHEAALGADADVELDVRGAQVAALGPAATERGPAAPFDVERDGGGLSDRKPADRGAASAPFDVERESVRAA